MMMNKVSTNIEMITTNYEDTYKKFSLFNKQNQDALDELKGICISLNTAEDTLRDKIRLIYTELESINKEFSNIMDIYSQIISVSTPTSVSAPTSVTMPIHVLNINTQ